MDDIALVTFSDAVVLLSQEEVEGASPRTIRVTSNGGLRYTSRVFINDFAIDSFSAASSRVVLIYPPETLSSIDAADMDIVLHTSRRTSSQGPAVLTIGPTKNVRSISGINKLTQQVTKVLLTNQRTNRFDTSEGGNLMQGLGESFSPNNKTEIMRIVTQAVVNTSKTIIKNQLTQSLPADEKLLSLAISNV